MNRLEIVLTRAGWTTAALLSGLWAFLMPHGFPIGHARFLMNVVAPACVVLMALAILVQLHRKRYRLPHDMNALAGGLVVGAAVAGRFWFPQSAHGRWWIVLVPGCVLVIWAFRRRRTDTVWYTLAAAGVILGAQAVGTQSAADAATRPRLGQAVTFEGPAPERGMIRFTRGDLRITLDPYLTFLSGSPDGCWSIFAPRGHAPPVPELVGARKDHDGDSWDIDVVMSLEREVYSHLNTFSRLDVAGSKNLALRFSACKGSFEVKPQGYPFGAPARFAYVDANRRFRVVEASSAEKGPFTVLGEGTLPEDAALTITLLDDGTEVCSITFRDFAAQLSTALSPTAGWGVAQNSIEFSLDERGHAHVFLTLAATSVGRGWDTVGHTGGYYRNRILVR